MAEDDFPLEYDDIVIGTGVQESIIAAALARNGHKVLHLDRNDYYSGEWASFHLKGMLDWIKRNQSTDGDKDESSDVDRNEMNEAEEDMEEGLRILPLPPPHKTATNIDVEIHVKEKMDKLDPTDLSSKIEERGASQFSASSSSSGPEHSSTSSGPEHSAHHIEQEAHEVTSPLETVENHSPTSQPIDEATNEVTTPEQQASQLIIPSASTEGRQRDWTWEDIMKDWRKFNIDLAPKLMFCRGAMVELLVSSRISRYAEFKAVTRILTHINGRLEQVPCSRADVFSSRYVSVLEKRMLMKLIEFCLDHENRQDEYRDYMDKPFAEFLHSRKLSPTLQHFVIHSIAMTSSNTPTQKALQAMKYFLSSLGRYGNTAFLWTLYGSGELPQCFCRMCAVFGGIYVLRTSIKNMIADSENNIRGIIDSGGKRLKCRNLILEHSYAYGNSTQYSASYLSRGILITDKSIKQSTTEQITFLTIPPCDDRDQPVHVIEVGYAACAAPRNLYVVHLTARANNKDVTAKDDLHHIVNTFFQVASKGSAATVDYDQPRVLWSVFFTQEDVTGIPDDALKGTLPANVHVTCGAGRSIGFDHAVSQAKQIFEKLCPGEDFLPPAPDPEDLVFEDSAKENTSQVGFDNNSMSEEGKEKPTSEEGKEKPTSEEGKEKPTSGEGKERPTSEEGKEKPTSEDGKERPTFEEGKERPTSGEGKEKPTFEEGKKKPTSGEGKEKPTFEEGKKKPTSGEGKEKPTFEEGKKKPTSGEGKERPTSEEGKEKPTSEEGKEKPTSGEGRDKATSEDISGGSLATQKTPNKVEKGEVD